MATIKPVAQWTTYDDAQQAVQAGLLRDYETCRRIIEDGDHWLDGDGWIGHRTGDAVVDAALRDRVRPQFVADDVLGELVENRTDGIIGQEADIQLESLVEPESEEERKEQQAETDRLHAALADWWDRKKLWEKVAVAVDRVSYARRGAVMAFISDGNLRRETTPEGQPVRTLPRNKTLAEALDLVDLDTPAPNMATRYIDPTTQRAHAVVLTKIGDQDRAHVWSVNPETRQTELRVFVKGGGTPAGFALDLGGGLPLGEATGKRIVTPAVRMVQSLLNFIMTVTGRTVETAGFRERHVTNAEPHLLWLTTKPPSTPVVKTQKDDNGHDILWAVETPPVFGAGILSRWVGIDLEAPEGQARQITTPQVTSVEPVNSAFATDAADKIRVVLYKRGKQGHLATEGTAEASGTAYQQKRAQHEADLKRLKSPVEGMIRDVLGAVFGLAGQMSEEARGILARYRIVVAVHISAGPVTADEARLAIEQRNARVISAQTCQARSGVEDPEAEQAAIDADPMTRAEFWNKMSEALDRITRISGAEMTAAGAAYLLGLTPEQIEVLRTGQPPAPRTEPPPAPALVA